MPFLPPNQQRQSTEGTYVYRIYIVKFARMSNIMIICCVLGVKQAKLTTVEPGSTSRNLQRPTGSIGTSTPRLRATTSSPTADKSPSPPPPRITPSPQPSSRATRRPHVGRKHASVPADVARSRMLWSTAGVKGAVVALSLGIVVTILTLAYVGCHYRHQRRLSRRHRHLPAAGSNDTDYLVNGMYL